MKLIELIKLSAILLYNIFLFHEVQPNCDHKYNDNQVSKVTLEPKEESKPD